MLQPRSPNPVPLLTAHCTFTGYVPGPSGPRHLITAWDSFTSPPPVGLLSKIVSPVGLATWPPITTRIRHPFAANPPPHDDDPVKITTMRALWFGGTVTDVCAPGIVMNDVELVL